MFIDESKLSKSTLERLKAILDDGTFTIEEILEEGIEEVEMLLFLERTNRNEIK